MAKQNHVNKQRSNSSGLSSIADMPSHQDIKVLAYWIHEEKGGSDLENWLEAERVLKERRYSMD
jgi:hypothetical protein